MASKAGSSAGYFFVTSQCRDPVNWTKEIKIGSTTAEHNIDVENGSSLPYDVTVQTDLPRSGTSNLSTVVGRPVRIGRPMFRNWRRMTRIRMLRS